MGFTPDHDAFNRQVLSAPWMQAHMLSIVERAKVIAEAIAPEASGEYKASFEVSSGIRETNGPRAIATLRNTSDHAAYVEFGGLAYGDASRPTEAHHVLAKAIIGGAAG